MKITKTKQLTSDQSSQINQLWNDEYPAKLKDRFPILLDGATSFSHYIIEDKNQVIAWAVEFEKDYEIRFSVIVHPAHQGKGLGALMMNTLKEDLDEFYGWVIDHDNDIKMNGEPYKTPLPFYIQHGFIILPEQRINNDMLKAVKVKWSNNK